MRHAERLWEDTMIGTVKEKPQGLDEAKSAAKEFLDTYAASGMERGVSAAKRMVSIVAYHGEAVTKLTWGDVSTASSWTRRRW